VFKVYGLTGATSLGVEVPAPISKGTLGEQRIHQQGPSCARHETGVDVVKKRERNSESAHSSSTGGW